MGSMRLSKREWRVSMNKLVNIKTGEVLSVDDDDDKFSEAYRQVQLEIKRLEEISNSLKEVILDRIRPDDKSFGGFWEVQHQTRSKLVFPDKQTEKTFKEAVKRMGKPYEVSFKLDIIKFPKY